MTDQEHASKIRSAISDLNQAMEDAGRAGIITELDMRELACPWRVPLIVVDRIAKEIT